MNDPSPCTLDAPNAPQSRGREEAVNVGLFCPSAQPAWEGSVVLGVVGGTAAAPRVAYLAEPLPVTDELLALAAPVTPTEVFRIAAPCAGSACCHFVGAACTLVERIVDHLPLAVEEGLPPCHLRPQCRWWAQEGKAACARCPQVVTDNWAAPDLIRLVAAPPVSALPG
jgi:hypothetical protein